MEAQLQPCDIKYAYNDISFAHNAIDLSLAGLNLWRPCWQ